MNSYGFVFIACALFVTGEAWDWNPDCLVSEWTAWNTEPFGFGQISRERRILRWPSGTGKQCPALVESKFTAQPPTTQQQAVSFTTNFLQYYGGTRVKRQTTGQLRDLLIILDSSGSIGGSTFSDAKTQIGRLLGLLCPHPDPFDPGYQQVALVVYSNAVREVFQLNSYHSLHDVQSAISGAPYFGQSTCTATAFNYVDDVFTAAKGARLKPSVKQEVLVITDGKSNCGGDAIQAAQTAQSVADIYGLMIGSFGPTDKDEVTNYVSNPASQHLFYLKAFAELKDFVDHVEAEMNKYSAPCAPFDI